MVTPLTFSRNSLCICVRCIETLVARWLWCPMYNIRMFLHKHSILYFHFSIPTIIKMVFDLYTFNWLGNFIYRFGEIKPLNWLIRIRFLYMCVFLLAIFLFWWLLFIHWLLASVVLMYAMILKFNLLVGGKHSFSDKHFRKHTSKFDICALFHVFVGSRRRIRYTDKSKSNLPSVHTFTFLFVAEIHWMQFGIFALFLRCMNSDPCKPYVCVLKRR